MAEAAEYPTSITTQLYQLVARKSTTLTADIDNDNTTLTVAATSGFPSKGFVSIGNETIYYSGSSATTFTGCTRGYAGTAVSHNEDDEVKLVVAAASINRIRLEIAAIQNYIGASGTTYANSLGYIIGRSNYLGTSTEGQLNVGYLGGSTEGQLNAGKVDDFDLVPDISGGWFPAGETWTYAGADDPTFTFTITGDKTGKYSVGMKIKLTQTTVKYSIITKVAYSDPNTTVTIYGGTDYNLTNAAITLPYYSTQKSPLNFPLDPDKWTVEVTDTTARSQATPTQSTWYNMGSVSINIPIGIWRTYYNLCANCIDSATDGWVNTLVTLSTANNSESDADYTTYNGFYTSTSNTQGFYHLHAKEKNLVLTTKDTYYINTTTLVVGADSIANANDDHKLIIRAVCAYL